MIDLKTKLYWLLRGSYNPLFFWEQWGKTFIDEPMQRAIYPQHKWILQLLLREKPRTLLEVGCGFGRNIRYILDHYPYPLVITGIDFSTTMLENAKTYLGMKQASSVTLQHADVLKLPFSSASFDTILCHGVLMHMGPRTVEKAISELVRVTKNTLIVIEQNDSIKPLCDKPYQRINFFTYTYPYKKLFRAQGVKVSEYHRQGQLDWLFIHDIQKNKEL